MGTFRINSYISSKGPTPQWPLALILSTPPPISTNCCPKPPRTMRQMLEGFINQILSAQADTVCGAEYGTTSDTRVNLRNGYRHRPLDTRVGTIDVAIPKLRHGSFFPDWLLERRTRVERALTTVIATCYLTGVSTRRMNDLVATLNITNLSKSQVSDMAKDLDAMVEDFRTRPLDFRAVFIRLV